MTLLEKNRIILGIDKGRKWGNKEGARVCTNEEFMQFMSYLNINEKYRSVLRSTEYWEEFYECCPLFSNDFDSAIKRDLFYAAKLNFKFTGVFSELTFLIKKAFKNLTPNVAVTSIKWQARMFLDGYMPEGVTIKDVMDNIAGQEVKLITDANRKVLAGEDIYEVYVENTDRVIILPKGIADYINSIDDLRNVKFIKDVGVCVYDVPLRTLDNRVGVCLDEYDLRECL